MSHAATRTIVAVLMLAALAGCAAPGAAPGGPGSVTTYLHGQTAVTFGTLLR
ncbi:MAG: hypothetical protein ACJ8AW_01080 [Rhodopila sp.]